MTQTAYQILVSSSTNGSADLWDSGIVKSDNTVNIRYAGKPLKSRQLALWKVKVWDQNGIMAQSLRNAEFGMGLLEKNDWKAKWINAPAGMQKDVIKSLDQTEQKVKTTSCASFISFSLFNNLINSQFCFTLKLMENFQVYFQHCISANHSILSKQKEQDYLQQPKEFMKFMLTESDCK